MLTNVLKYDEKKHSDVTKKQPNHDFKYKMLGGLGPNIGTDRWNEKMALYKKKQSVGLKNELINTSLL